MIDNGFFGDMCVKGYHNVGTHHSMMNEQCRSLPWCDITASTFES